MIKYTSFRDIPKFLRGGSYRVDCDWDYFPKWVERQQDEAGLQLNPDFQRGHVWTEKQQISYVEFCLQGGSGARNIFFNCPDWPEATSRQMVMVDGLQRVTAVLRFMKNEIRAFGSFYSEFTDSIRFSRTSFSVNVNNLKTRVKVLRWYLELNMGGVVHTKKELDRVKALLKLEVDEDDPVK